MQTVWRMHQGVSNASAGLPQASSTAGHGLTLVMPGMLGLACDKRAFRLCGRIMLGCALYHEVAHDASVTMRKNCIDPQLWRCWLRQGGHARLSYT